MTSLTRTNTSAEATRSMSAPPLRREGDATNPARWIDEHGDALFAMALRTVRDRNEAEEIVQETLLAALESRSTFRGESSERTWLIGILRHKLLDHLRRRSREPLLQEEHAAAETLRDKFNWRGIWRHSPTDAPELERPDPERAELRSMINQCLRRLPRRTAEVFLLCEEHGLTAEKVGKSLGTTAQSVWSAMYRARMLLRECLEQRGITSTGEGETDPKVDEAFAR